MNTRPIVACLITTMAAQASPTAQVDATAHPELQIDALLSPLIAGLKRNLPDPYSVRDLTICEPVRVKLKDGHPISWIVNFALNARGQAGGYTGLTTYAATFRDGEVKTVFGTSLASDDGFDRLINRGLMNRISRCRLIPQARVQPLLDGEHAP